jgi:hypothetical protein
MGYLSIAAATTRQQGACRHDLPRLAITTLRDVDLLPGDLDGMGPIFREPFDRGDGLVADCPDRRQARAGVSAGASTVVERPFTLSLYAKRFPPEWLRV